MRGASSFENAQVYNFSVKLREGGRPNLFPKLSSIYYESCLLQLFPLCASSGRRARRRALSTAQQYLVAVPCRAWMPGARARVRVAARIAGYYDHAVSRVSRASVMLRNSRTSVDMGLAMDDDVDDLLERIFELMDVDGNGTINDPEGFRFGHVLFGENRKAKAWWGGVVRDRAAGALNRKGWLAYMRDEYLANKDAASAQAIVKFMYHRVKNTNLQLFRGPASFHSNLVSKPVPTSELPWRQKPKRPPQSTTPKTSMAGQSRQRQAWSLRWHDQQDHSAPPTKLFTPEL